MALRFLARDGSRRLHQRHWQQSTSPQSAERRWSCMSRFISQEISSQKDTILKECSPQSILTCPPKSLANVASFAGRKALSEITPGLRVGSQELSSTKLPALPFRECAKRAFHSEARTGEQVWSQGHIVPSVEVQSLLSCPHFRLWRSGFREASCSKPSLCHKFSRTFWSSSAKKILSSSKGDAAAVVSNKLPLKGISTDSIAQKLKLSPSTLKKPVDDIKETASRYKQVAGLQIEAFWKRNVMILVGAVGILACFLLWQIMYGVANLFVSFSEGMAKFGFLAMAAATVAFAAMALRARFTINPDKVYRIAMRMLNTSAAALEVLGAPLTGTDLRAYVMSSGGLKLKNLKPRWGSRRCFLIFPIQGSEKRGLVSAEVKKKKGKYDFKMLAIDVAVPGAEHRVFLVGDEAEYKVGGGLIGQLRGPILKAMAAQEEFDAQDEKEAEEERKAEEARIEQEMLEEEARRKEEVERLERESVNK